jgi:hypothetical protein
MEKDFTLAALLGSLKQQRDLIDKQIDYVDRLMGEMRLLTGAAAIPSYVAPSTPGPKTKPAAKRRLSAAGRKAIADAAKRRWALIRQSKDKAAAQTNTRSKTAARRKPGRPRKQPAEAAA